MSGTEQQPSTVLLTAKHMARELCVSEARVRDHSLAGGAL